MVETWVPTSACTLQYVYFSIKKKLMQKKREQAGRVSSKDKSHRTWRLWDSEPELSSLILLSSSPRIRGKSWVKGRSNMAKRLVESTAWRVWVWTALRASTTPWREHSVQLMLLSPATAPPDKHCGLACSPGQGLATKQVPLMSQWCLRFSKNFLHSDLILCLPRGR